MKAGLQLSLAAIAVALALGAGYWFGRNAAPGSLPAPAEPETATLATSGQASANTPRTVLYYRNPMGLPDTSPVPKKDSMGMDYIPVYEDESGDDSGTITVSPARIQMLGVKTELARLSMLESSLRAVGRIELNERTVVEVAPRFEGWIERLHVNAVGDPVRRGQALFTVYSPELQSAGEELRIAQQLQRDSAGADPIAAEAAARLADAGRARLRNWEVPAPNGAPAGQPAARQTFHSPATGIVLEKNAVQGARFMPGESIYRIADLSTVWVLADIFEQDLDRVRVGQRARVSVDAFPGRQFDARVAYLYPTVSAATRSTPLRLELDNREGLLRPGMFAHVEITEGPGAPRLSVPTSAVIDDGSRQVVLIALEGGRFKPQPITLGRRGRDEVEVLEGIEAGARVVVSANFLIDSESQLRAAFSNLGGGDETARSERQTAAQIYHAEGVFEAYDAAGGTVTLSHQPIPELNWPEMTMDFELASPDMAAGILPGTAVHFEFSTGEPGEYVVTRIQSRAGPAPTPVTKSGPVHEAH